MIEDVSRSRSRGNRQRSWHEIARTRSKRRCFENGKSRSNPALHTILEKLESVSHESPPEIIFVADLRIRKTHSPDSMVAAIWNECLGPSSIPFDPAARQALIEHGRKHPELKRHIDAWEEMKRTGSQWVTGP